MAVGERDLADPALGVKESHGEPRVSRGPDAVVLDGAASGLFAVSETADLAPYFGTAFEHRVLEGVGHNPPQEAPAAFADAIQCLPARRSYD